MDDERIERALRQGPPDEPAYVPGVAGRVVLDMGTTVGLTVVVEGVESEEVDDLVRRMGVGYAQGSYYGQAMTAPELAEMSDRLAKAESDRPNPRESTAGHPYAIRRDTAR